jgi:hypothetical protein
MSFGGGLNFFRILYRVTAEDAPPARRSLSREQMQGIALAARRWCVLGGNSIEYSKEVKTAAEAHV